MNKVMLGPKRKQSVKTSLHKFYPIVYHKNNYLNVKTKPFSLNNDIYTAQYMTSFTTASGTTTFLALATTFY